ncbi:sulfotransferase [Henriciella sp.]|uniref:sulfotransferase family protein n=1 Tax=Henriciella sp. TaxID=1968823 RepID=UPI0025BBDEB2|nr:sulfotransferase [Henriciella sp.]
MIDFFGVGTQKGGTTALFNALSKHPGLCLAERKELHLFDDERIDWRDPDLSGALDEFPPHSEEALLGDITPIYAYWPNALERIARYNPDARLIFLLRHPAYRAYSHWKMETKRGNEKLDFETAISQEGRQRVAASLGGVSRVYSYVERGFYPAQIRRMLSLFPRHRVLIRTTDRLWTQPEQVLQEIQKFLGVEVRSLASPSYVVPVDTSSAPPMPAHCRKALDALYADPILESAKLSGLDLARWLDPDYEEPMLPEGS